ncbi:MaoC dehydratase-like protein [Streptomyces sp. 846.5]|nr:MaoC family dehydratase N-terminal domain-containing protein [Streptomyces sp. 846.5]TDU01784.1 MaoC dehydratase-like protein [Streptomyces sp. 846.5]
MPAGSFPVEAGHILMFARAIGDEDPEYHAALRDVNAGAVAPPTFTMASAHHDPDYPLRPRPGSPWLGSGQGPGVASAGGGGLHAEQHFEYHRPLRPGDTLTARVLAGRNWEKSGRAGLLRFSETVTEFRDEQGELVVTSRTVGVVPEAPVAARNTDSEEH